MKILFLGGTGRLSKDVAARALACGHEVTLLTRGSASRSLFVDDAYEMLIGDVRDQTHCAQLMNGRHFDVVIDFLSLNVSNLANTLTTFASHCNQFIFISSATVYVKDCEDEIIAEGKTRIGNNKWSYAYNKYLCEQYLMDFCAKNDGAPFYTIIRPYVTYGCTRVPYPIVPRKATEEWTFVERIKIGVPIPIFDKGDTRTTITHTQDFAIGVVGLFGNPKAYSEAFHITGDEEVSWGLVLDILEEKIGKPCMRIEMTQNEIYTLLPEYKPVLLGDKGQSMRFDNSKIISAVPDFSASITLRQGVSEMVDFYESHPSLQIVNWRWMGRVDRLCASMGYKVGSNAYGFSNLKNAGYYWSGRLGINKPQQTPRQHS